MEFVAAVALLPARMAGSRVNTPSAIAGIPAAHIPPTWGSVAVCTFHSPTDVKCCLVLICLCMIANDLELLFSCLSAFWISFLSIVHMLCPVFRWGYRPVFFFYWLGFLGLNPLSIFNIANIFSHFLSCLLTLSYYFHRTKNL